VARRLAVSLWEIKRYNQYQYVIINDDVERAADVLAAIILEKRHRLSRIGPRAERVLNSFAVAAGRQGLGTESEDEE
jgi:guanylate kinase